MTSPSNCFNCKTSGLPIIPARYSVVPSFIKPDLPAAIKDKRVTSIALDSSQYAYALRTLRSGYMYLLYEDGPRGKNYWEVYIINEDGSIIKQVKEYALLPPKKEIKCSTQGHIAERTHYFCIEEPDKCGTVWIAYSEKEWTISTLGRYTSNKALRTARMQSIEPAQWVKTPSNDYACEATSANLEKVLEYTQNIDLKFGLSPQIEQISNPDGKHSERQLKLQTTLFPVRLRNQTIGQRTVAANTVKLMQYSGKRADGKSHPPMLLAVWDAVGITRELNGYRNEVAGRIEQYGEERVLEITTLHQIEGIQKTLHDAAVNSALARPYQNMETSYYDPAKLAGLRAKAQTMPEPQRKRELEYCDRMESYGRNYVPYNPYGDRLTFVHKLSEPTRSTELAQLDQRVKEYLARRDKSTEKPAQDASNRATKDWAKYAEKLDKEWRDDFRRDYDAFLKDADKLIDQRTVELVKWLEAQLLVDTLEDFDPKNVFEGVQFDDLIGDVIFGISSSSAGAKKIEQWAKEANATAKSNLLWRAIALNQEEGIPELNAMLQLAKAHEGTPLTEKAAAIADKHLKDMAKLADLYKKSQSFADTLAKAEEKGLKKFSMAKIDKLVISIGEPLYKAFGVNKTVDTLGQKILQHVLCIRAFVDPRDSLKLVLEQGKHQTIANTQMIERFQQAKTFLDMNGPELKSVQRDALNQAWAGLKPDKAANAIRDARLALVVAIFEGANLAKCASQLLTGSKRDARTGFAMLASSLAITALMLDVAATAAKNVFNQTADDSLKGMGDAAKAAAKDFGERSWSYQKLKLCGGALSAGASLIGAAFDYKDADEAFKKDKYKLGLLYSFKFFVSGGNVIFGLATAVTYAPQLTAQIIGRTVGANAARVITNRAITIAAFRLIGMGLGGWLTVASLAITAIIYWFTDTELQKWCSRCPFGQRRTVEPYNNLKQQQEELEKALIEAV